MEIARCSDFRHSTKKRMARIEPVMDLGGRLDKNSGV